MQPLPFSEAELLNLFVSSVSLWLSLSLFRCYSMPIPYHLVSQCLMHWYYITYGLCERALYRPNNDPKSGIFVFRFISTCGCSSACVLILLLLFVWILFLWWDDVYVCSGWWKNTLQWFNPMRTNPRSKLMENRAKKRRTKQNLRAALKCVYTERARERARLAVITHCTLWEAARHIIFACIYHFF